MNHADDHQVIVRMIVRSSLDRFPYQYYMNVGSLQTILGLIIIVLGGYNLCLFYHPEWFVMLTDCSVCMDKSYPIRSVTQRTLILSVPVTAGVLFVFHGFLTSWSCHTSTRQLKIHVLLVKVISAFNAAITCPTTMTVEIIQGSYAIKHELHYLQYILPFSSCAVAMVMFSVSLWSLVLACRTTVSNRIGPQYSEIPMIGTFQEY